jgi:hypothetical protein
MSCSAKYFDVSPPKICSKQMQKITEADDMYLENVEGPVCWQNF